MNILRRRRTTHHVMVFVALREELMPGRDERPCTHVWAQMMWRPPWTCAKSPLLCCLRYGRGVYDSILCASFLPSLCCGKLLLLTLFYRPGSSSGGACGSRTFHKGKVAIRGTICGPSSNESLAHAKAAQGCAGASKLIKSQQPCRIALPSLGSNFVGVPSRHISEALSCFLRY